MIRDRRGVIYVPLITARLIVDHHHLFGRGLKTNRIETAGCEPMACRTARPRNHFHALPTKNKRRICLPHGFASVSTRGRARVFKMRRLRISIDGILRRWDSGLVQNRPSDFRAAHTKHHHEDLDRTR